MAGTTIRIPIDNLIGHQGTPLGDFLNEVAMLSNLDLAGPVKSGFYFESERRMCRSVPIMHYDGFPASIVVALKNTHVKTTVNGWPGWIRIPVANYDDVVPVYMPNHNGRTWRQYKKPGVDHPGPWSGFRYVPTNTVGDGRYFEGLTVKELVDGGYTVLSESEFKDVQEAEQPVDPT